MNWLRAHARWTALNLIGLIVMISLLAKAEPLANNLSHPVPSLASGKWAFRFLLASLSMTPLQRYLGWKHALKLRKPAGLWSFGFASLHLLLTLRDRPPPWRLPLRQPFLLLGLIAFLVLSLLAITSNRWAMRSLKKNWKRLHRLVYPAAVAIASHALLATSYSRKMPVEDPESAKELQAYLALVLVLLAVRVPQVRAILRRIRPHLLRPPARLEASSAAIEIRAIPVPPTKDGKKQEPLPTASGLSSPSVPLGQPESEEAFEVPT